MVYRSHGDWGAFGKGFSEAFAAMLKLAEDKRHNQALEDHWARMAGFEQFKFTHSPDYLASQAAEAARNKRRGESDDGSGSQPSHPATGGWWTPERMQYAADRLQKEAGLSEAGAAGLVARWSGVESAGGPDSVNPTSGAVGIGQWLGDRKVGVGSTFDEQITHAVKELNGTEKAAGDALRRASTPEEGARGASMFERAEGYNASTGKDNFTDRTPVQHVMATIRGTTDGSKPTKTTETAKADAPATATATTKPPVTPSPAGGASVVYKGKEYQTDKDGNILPDTGKQVSQADAKKGNYKVAGLNNIALTPDEAAKANADLEAHRFKGPEGPPELPSEQPPAAPAGDDRVFHPENIFQQGGGRSLGHLPVFPSPEPNVSPYRDAADPSEEINKGPPGIPGTDVTSQQPTGTRFFDPTADPSNRTTSTYRPEDAPTTRYDPLSGKPTGVPYYDPLEGKPTGGAPPPPITTTEGRTDLRPTPYRPEDSPSAGPVTNEPSIAARSNTMANNAAAAANAPASDAQPVSAEKPVAAAIPATPQRNDRFVQITRPNIDQSQGGRGGGGPPQMTALNFASLWGPNPPLAQRNAEAARPAPAAAPARSSRPDDDSVPAPDMSAMSDDAFAGRRGGPVHRFQHGGAIPTRPSMRYADSGAAVAPSSMYASSSSQIQPSQVYTAMDNLLYGAGMPYSQQDIMYGRSDMTVGDMMNANFSKLTPEQQQWYNQQDAALGGYRGGQQAMSSSYTQPTGGWGGQAPTVNTGMQALAGNQLGYYQNLFSTTPPATPAAAAPAAAVETPVATPAKVAPASTDITAPVADTTTGDPTTTAGSGAVGLTDIVSPSKTPTDKSNAKNADPNNVDLATGASFKNTQNSGGVNYTVGTDDLLKTNKKGNDIAGFRQGGAIPSRAMRYATAGPVAAAPSAATMATPGWGSTLSTYTTGPDASPLTNQQLYSLQQTVNADPAGPFMGSYSDWLTGANNSANPAGASRDLSSYYGSFAAPVTTTAAAPLNEPAPTSTDITAPVADTTTGDPTTTAGSGAVGLTDTVTPASTDITASPTKAEKPAKTAKTTTTSTTPKQTATYDPTQSTNYGNSNYSQMQGFDDGGEVSPSAMGMPPGLSGGQQPIAPIYYSGATYAPAGAPVGKGITQNSAPTYIAGAIPSLPMVKGGIVRYADGGSVEDGESQTADYYGGAPSGAAPGDMPDTGQYGGGDSYESAGSPQDAHPDLPAWTPQVNDGQGNPSRGLVGAIAGGLHYIASQLGLDGSGQPSAIAQDPNTQANRRSFAQGQGLPGAPMPTRDEMSQLHQAIGTKDGLHEGLANLAGMEAARNFWLIRGDPGKADQMAASMLQYSVSLSKDYGDQAVQRWYANDPNGSLHALLKAKEAVADGTMMDAKINYDKDGNPVSVNVQGKDLNGKSLWAETVAPEAILGAALHARDGSLAWHMYELQAAKYDKPTADIIAARKERMQQADANEQIGKFGPVSTPYEGGPSQAPQIEPVNVPSAPQPPMPAEGPLAAGQPAIPGPPQVAGLANPPTSAGQLGVDASRAQPSPGQQAILEANRGRSADTTTAQPAAQPQTADDNAVPEPPAPADQNQQRQQVPPAIPPGAEIARALNPPPAPTPGVGPTREAAAAMPAPDAQEVAALSPQVEQARYRQIEQTVRAKYTDPKTGGIVLDHQLYQPAPPMDQATFAKQEKTVRDAWNERWKIFQWAAGEADRRAAAEIDAQRRDYGQSLASQRAQATMTQQQSLEDRRETARQTAAALAETNKQKDALQAEKYKTVLNEHNTAFSANSAGSAPLNDTEKKDRVARTASGASGAYDPVIDIAQAFNPDLGTVTRDQAIGDLTRQKIDVNTQNALADIYDKGIDHSRTSSPAQVGAAIQSFVTGGHAVWKPEQVDAKGNPVPVHGVVRFDMTVADNSGNMIHIRLPEDKMGQLIAIQQRYAPIYAQGMPKRLAQDVHSKGLLALPPAPGMLPLGAGVESDQGETFTPPPASAPSGYNPATVPGWEQPPF